MLANSLSVKVIRGTLLAFRDQLGFSAFLLRSDNSFTRPLISRAYIVSAHHPAFPLVYTCMVSTSGSTGYQCDGACMDATYRVAIAMQCTRLQFLAQLASHQTLMVVIVLAFFNRVQKGIPYTAGFRKTLFGNGF